MEENKRAERAKALRYKKPIKSVGGVDFQCQHLVWKEEG